MSNSPGKKSGSRKKKSGRKKAVKKASSARKATSKRSKKAAAKKTGRKKAAQASVVTAKKSRKKAAGKKSRASKAAARKAAAPKKAAQRRDVESIDVGLEAVEANVTPKDALELLRSQTTRKPITEDLDTVANLSEILDRQSPEDETTDEESYDAPLDPSLDLPEEYRPTEYSRSSHFEASDMEEEDILDVLCAQGSSVDGAAELMELSMQEMDASLGIASIPNLDICDTNPQTDSCPNLSAHTGEADVEVLEELEDIATLDARENVLKRKEAPELPSPASVDAANSEACDTADSEDCADAAEVQQTPSLLAKIHKMRRAILDWFFPPASKGEEI